MSTLTIAFHQMASAGSGEWTVNARGQPVQIALETMESLSDAQLFDFLTTTGFFERLRHEVKDRIVSAQLP
jgi:hypothetical protein